MPAGGGGQGGVHGGAGLDQQSAVASEGEEETRLGDWESQ